MLTARRAVPVLSATKSQVGHKLLYTSTAGIQHHYFSDLEGAENEELLPTTNAHRKKETENALQPFVKLPAGSDLFPAKNR